MISFDLQVDNNGGASEKPPPAAENSKEVCTPEPAADPGECGSGDAQVAGVGSGDGLSSDKGEVEPAPIADGTCLESGKLI